MTDDTERRLYWIVCKDKPDLEECRESLRPRHLEYIRQNEHIISVGARVINDKKNAPCGTAYILNVDSMAEAENFISSEPYYLGDLFQQVEIIPLQLQRAVLPKI